MRSNKFAYRSQIRDQDQSRSIFDIVRSQIETKSDKSDTNVYFFKKGELIFGRELYMEFNNDEKK